MITLILFLALLGFIVYVLVTYIPMPPVFKNALIVVAVIMAILIVMRAFGIDDIPVRR